MYRTRQDLMLIASAMMIFAYVTHWLMQHSVTGQPHHYITAVVIVLWLASLPALSLYRFLTERRNHHGYF
jgi:hypothetical protein